MTPLFFLFFTFDGSTVFFNMYCSLGGTSGGIGAFLDLFPIFVSFPVLKICTACLVLSTCTMRVSAVMKVMMMKSKLDLQGGIRGTENEHRPFHQCSRRIGNWNY